MEFTALEPWKLIVLMAAGGLFSLVGLWLIFKPKTDGHSMVIHVAGLKLEASSAGVLVFLIGTAFFATPLFVQARSQETTAAEPLEAGNERGSSNREGPTLTARSGYAVSIVAEEAEPNDTIPDANKISIGSSILGEVMQGERDFYTVSFPEGYRGTLSASVDGGHTRLNLYDDLGAKITGTISKWRTDVDLPRYYIAVYTLSSRRERYQLTVAARPD